MNSSFLVFWPRQPDLDLILRFAEVVSFPIFFLRHFGFCTNADILTSSSVQEAMVLPIEGGSLCIAGVHLNLVLRYLWVEEALVIQHLVSHRQVLVDIYEDSELQCTPHGATGTFRSHTQAADAVGKGKNVWKVE